MRGNVVKLVIFDDLPTSSLILLTVSPHPNRKSAVPVPAFSDAHSFRMAENRDRRFAAF
jgi:hypothetical protein